MDLSDFFRIAKSQNGLEEEMSFERGSAAGEDLSRMKFEGLRFVKCRFDACVFSQARFIDCSF